MPVAELPDHLDLGRHRDASTRGELVARWLETSGKISFIPQQRG